MKGLFLSPGLHLLVRASLSVVFIVAGIAKLIDPKAFAKTVSQYDIVPEFLLAPFAVGLPSVELLAGLGLVFNIRGSLAAVVGLLVMFILVLGYGVINEMAVDCGCFGPEEINAHNNLKQALFRDLLMMTAACYLYAYRRIRRTTDQNSNNKIHY